jgi:hypothetical protein
MDLLAHFLSITSLIIPKLQNFTLIHFHPFSQHSILILFVSLHSPPAAVPSAGTASGVPPSVTASAVGGGGVVLSTTLASSPSPPPPPLLFCLSTQSFITCKIPFPPNRNFPTKKPAKFSSAPLGSSTGPRHRQNAVPAWGGEASKFIHSPFPPKKPPAVLFLSSLPFF